MFGDTKDMYGTVEDLSIDCKGRITLPNYCNAEYGDVLVVMAFKDRIDVINKLDFDYYKKHFEVTEHTCSDDLIPFIRTLRKGRDFTVDSQLRVCLGEKLRTEYDFNGRVYIVGNGVYISIRTKEMHDAYLNSIKQPDAREMVAKVRKMVREENNNR